MPATYVVQLSKGQGQVEFDHIYPIAFNMCGERTGLPSIVWMLPRRKTLAQVKQNRTLLTRTSKHVWREYIESACPPALVWSPHSHKQNEQLVELDVRRCRKNALPHCAYQLPIWCPFANIVPTKPGRLAVTI